VKKETKHWYLPLDKYELWLREWILESHKDDWKTNVYGQCKSWIDQGLQPRAVTRDLDWGVKVPLPEAQDKVLYVWFDAPIGYISATREWAEKTGKDWKLYWKDKETRLIHFIGKDNIVFHCIIFPAMLKHEGSYILPDNVPAFEFMNLESDKISTSRNWAVWLHEYLEDFPGKQDVLRYVLCANGPETKDNDFTWKDFQTRNNSELLAIFGNLVNRTLVLTHKYFNGKVPAAEDLDDYDKSVLAEIKEYPVKIGVSLDNFRFREALNELMNLARLGNKYLTDTEPWKVFKTEEARVRTILNISLQICANLAVLSEPFLPFTAAKLSAMLNLPDYKWKDAGNAGLLKDGQQLNNPELLFDKIEDDVIEAQIQKLLETKKNNLQKNIQVKPAKENVTYDDFSKLDLRVATVLEAERVPKTDKLLKLKIDTGFDQRTVISGIAGKYKPEDIIGKKVCMIVNLAPRSIRGTESKGMILSAENASGELCLIIPSEDFHNGSEIK
jgi:methionyl-tRNA synthetase